MSAVLVTGANGFVGRSLSQSLRRRGELVREAVRDSRGEQNVYSVGDISARTDWSRCLDECKYVIHLAARVHVMNDSASDPLASFRSVNVDGTLNLAQQAARRGIKRFVFVSSIKVNGEKTSEGRPFRAEDPPAPCGPYAVSKFEAESGLLRLATDSGMEVVIIRPPLVYGPGVKANFRTLVRCTQRGFPLPLGAVENKRSIVALASLVDLISLCIRHPKAANQIFLVSDGEDLSTPELISRIGAAVGKKARLVSVPPGIIKHGAALLGRGDVADRLIDSLQVDISKTREMLGWTPVISVAEALRESCSSLCRL